MRFSTPKIVAPILFAASACAQLYTTTLPWANGDTVVISTGTNVLGLGTTTTIRTVTTGITGGLAGTSSASSGSGFASASPSPSSSRSTSSTTRRTTTATTATGPVTTTNGQRVGDDTALPPPMRTTTYWYDPGDGSPWSVATWTASNTAAPTVATALVPQGTMQSYTAYAQSVNANVLASAVSSAKSGAGLTRWMPSQGSLFGAALVGAGAVLGAAAVF